MASAVSRRASSSVWTEASSAGPGARSPIGSAWAEVETSRSREYMTDRGCILPRGGPMSEVPAPPSDQGKMWAMLSYAGFFFGFPVCVIPLLQRDDPYALRHAKHATAVWLGVFGLTIVLGFVYTMVSFVTC